MTDAMLSLDDDSPRMRQATMGNRVFDALRQAIVQLQLRPGNLLSEAEVARQLGVSRQPVREAFIKLAEVGLVEVRPQRGTYVMLISIREEFLAAAGHGTVIGVGNNDKIAEAFSAAAKALASQVSWSAALPSACQLRHRPYSRRAVITSTMPSTSGRLGV